MFHNRHLATTIMYRYSAMIQISYIILALSCRLQFTGILISASGTNNSLHLATNPDCICSGDTVSYVCTITGRGTTVWQGSAFKHCATNSIALLHSQFTSDTGAYGTCNNGAIVAHSLVNDFNSSCYTSQLNVTISTDLDSSYIQCIYDNGANIFHVGELMVIKLKDALPPPNEIKLSLDLPGRLTFTWNEVSSDCTSVYYGINSSNCGICSIHATSHTMAVCYNIPTNGSLCKFSLQTVVCGNITGNFSDPILAMLRVPDVPTGIKVIPRYSYKDGYLSGLTTEFNHVKAPFNISYNISGSTLFYNITYTEVTSGIICGAVILSASSCDRNICQYVFDTRTAISSESCFAMMPSDYTISVSAANLVGSGDASSIIISIESITNKFVNVIFNLAFNHVICNFVDQEPAPDSEKRCSIRYYGPKNTKPSKNSYSLNVTLNSVTTTSSDSVIIALASATNNEQTTYFIVLAANETFAAEIEGTVKTECDLTQLGDQSSTPHGLLCDPPLLSLGITNGIVCYNGNTIGSVAVYSCLNCGINEMRGSIVRNCLDSGNWNGTMLECTCSSNYISLTVSLVVILAVLVFIAVQIAIVTIIIRKKKKSVTHSLNKQLITDTNKESDFNRNSAIYEELDRNVHKTHGTTICTKNNMAYLTVMSK